MSKSEQLSITNALGARGHLLGHYWNLNIRVFHWRRGSYPALSESNVI